MYLLVPWYHFLQYATIIVLETFIIFRYWICYSTFIVLETFIDYILFWVPMYYMFKIAFLAWLFMPQTKGAENVSFISTCLFEPLP